MNQVSSVEDKLSLVSINEEEVYKLDISKLNSLVSALMKPNFAKQDSPQFKNLAINPQLKTQILATALIFCQASMASGVELRKEGVFASFIKNLKNLS